MISSGKYRAEKNIINNRVKEENVGRLQTKLKQEFYERQFATWENKGQDVQKRNLIKQRLAQYRAQSQYKLQERREELKNILRIEHESYKRVKSKQIFSFDINLFFKN